MKPSAVLIYRPAIDFDTFLRLSHKLLGYGLSAKVDQSRIEHSDSVRFLSCLAAMRDPKASAGITPNLLSFAHFGVLIAAEERDLIDIIECAAGIPIVAAETISRGVMELVFVGSLALWRDAVKSGTSPTLELNVRDCFCQIMGLLEREGLAETWKDFQAKPLDDNTFYLEDKRR